MRRPAGLVAAAGLLSLVAALGGCAVAPPTPVTITIHYSAFDATALTAPHGVPVTFVLVNEDPIDHEWMLGDAEMHETHRNGTEAVHDTRPTEVTVPALSTVETTITFEGPGVLTYVCHLPGHEGYGMVGSLTVT